MVTKKELIDSVLMRELISKRIDTLWKMLALKKEGRFPGRFEEGATGFYDNKGAIFVPGGVIINGRLYYHRVYLYQGIYWTLLNYTLKPIADAHDSQGGTQGEYGFPVEDPQVEENNISQEFHNDREIILNKTTGQTSTGDYIAYRCDEYGDLSSPVNATRSGHSNSPFPTSSA